LTLLAVASIGTVFVHTTGELIAVRMLMGVAAAMTTSGSMALSFRLFDDDTLRVRASAVISTAGLVGVAVGPTVGGLLLAGFRPTRPMTCTAIRSTCRARCSALLPSCSRW
jgi:MFS family permease